MKRILIPLIVFLLGSAAGYFLSSSGIFNKGVLSPLGQPQEIPTPLYDYSIEKLRETKFEPKKIELVEKMSDGDGFQSWLFKFETAEGWVSGQMNLPNKISNFEFQISNSSAPALVMIRGYVDKEEYATGIGTKNAAAYFAKNGFITLAPDFLGYGQSDPEPTDDLKSRFIRPATILQLIESIGKDRPLGIWAHSNGGQIALSVLEITDKKIPTTLWAPVSKPFPYSILYYTDESDDNGKYLVNILSDFMRIYDPKKFSLTEYFSQIKSPVQLHQGTADEAVPQKWSDDLAKSLRKEKIDLNYFTYPGADHNLKSTSPTGGTGWDTAVSRDLEFFRTQLL